MLMADNTKMSLGIYQIDRLEFEKLNFNDVADLIIQKINLEEEEPKFHYKEQPLKRIMNDEFRVKIFHAIKVLPARWRTFFQNIIKEEADLNKSKNMYSSFIAFIGYKEDIFGIAGGHGNFSLPRFGIQDFGMEILTRIIKKDHKVIKGLQDRGVTGNVLGQTRFYRGDQRFIDEDQFGKIYKQVKAELNREILIKIFGFSKKGLKKKISGCLAKTSFQINKSIDFDTLLRVVSKFSTILKKDRNFSLNKVTQISKRSDNGKKLIERLESQLISELYIACKSNQTPDFDFCNKDFESYFSASNYIIERGRDTLKEYDELFNLETLISDLKQEGVLLFDSIEEFRLSFLNAYVHSFDEEGEKLTSGTILEHFHGEVFFDNRTYFIIDCEWYVINPDFINDLNIDCKECLAQTWDDQLISEYFDTAKSERYFNSQFIGKENCLVFDTVTHENIELCDVLKHEGDFIYLIHVKKGFNNSIRELVSQMTISAKRLLTDIKSNYSYIDSVERKIKKGIRSKSPFIKKLANQNFPFNGLKSIFVSKRHINIFFCLAFVDIGTKHRSLKANTNLFSSNIAKYSILELRKELSSLGLGVKIIQIPKVNSKA
jgi:uncharacterized protein (TIGR04141 family)